MVIDHRPAVLFVKSPFLPIFLLNLCWFPIYHSFHPIFDWSISHDSLVKSLFIDVSQPISNAFFLYFIHVFLAGSPPARRESLDLKKVQLFASPRASSAASSSAHWAPEPYRELRMQLGTHGPEHMPDRTPQRMPDRMSDRMSEYTSDRMPDIMSEYMSDRMSIGGDHSKKVTIFSSFCYLYNIRPDLSAVFPCFPWNATFGAYISVYLIFNHSLGLSWISWYGVPQSNGFIIIPLKLAYILDIPHFQTHKQITIWSTDEALSPYQSPM